MSISLPYKTAAVDVKPGACPNVVNTRSAIVLSVAVMGTQNMDVSLIDMSSLRLIGLLPERIAIEDAGAPFEPYVGKAGIFR